MKLVATNEKARAANIAALGQLNCEYQTYRANDSWGKIFNRATLTETHLEEVLVLKLGVSVMLLDNVDVENGWNNGTMAVTTELGRNHVKIKRQDGKELIVRPIQRYVYKASYGRSQIPLSLGYACTIHKV